MTEGLDKAKEGNSCQVTRTALLNTALPHLQCCVQLYTLHQQKVMDLMECQADPLTEQSLHYSIPK